MLHQLSVTANYALLAHNWSLRRRVVFMSEEGRLAEGKILETADMRSMHGEMRSIKLNGSDRRTIIYILNPSCSWSNRNLRNINALAQAQPGYQVIGVSTTCNGLAGFVKERTPRFEVFCDPIGPASLLKYGGTPQTAVLDRTGKVVKYWSGAFNSITQPEVERFFNTKLPGLSEGQ
jgi:hypothetical protein